MPTGVHGAVETPTGVIVDGAMPRTVAEDAAADAAAVEGTTSGARGTPSRRDVRVWRLAARAWASWGMSFSIFGARSFGLARKSSM